jgi:beta-galactosidase
MSHRFFAGRPAALIFGLLILAAAGSVFGQDVLPIADLGWRLWLDKSAAWKDDALFLPAEADLKLLPVHAPSGGWGILNRSTGVSVTLPATVEEHFWGDDGKREYKNEYWFERTDTDVKNGNYPGVSWWWKEISIPPRFQDKSVWLHIRGARLRAEVYLNGKLVGYDILGETSFVCDISAAALPGQRNLLAIRITNPGGWLDWVDTKLLTWGGTQFYAGHGFGGLDRGIFISAHAPVFVADAWVSNTPQPRRVKASARIRNTSDQAVRGELTFEAVASAGHDAILAARTKRLTIPAGGSLEVSEMLDVLKAELWTPDNPRLYRLRARFVGAPTPSLPGLPAWNDMKEATFGCRWFEADGIGTNAVPRLNGARIRLASAISWGFWGFNGLWPTPELAEREVWAAKSLGLNMLHFHRQIGRAEVLDAQDRLGLLRAMEPGGGQSALGERFPLYAKSPSGPLDTSGAGGDAQTFAERYMEEKIVRMVRDHRGHPSLALYILQNEIHPDLRNPRIFRLLRRVHAEDPSRVVLLKSGVPPVNQAWMKPYDETVYVDRGDGVSGWRDEHTVGGPGVWQDGLYKNPEEFTHRSAADKEIVVWGEMLGSGTPDNHAGIVRDIEKRGGASYDIEDHREILAAYDRFLDKWGFRDAYPTADKLFLDIGDKSYDFWGRALETARLSEANDAFVISGWESTAIENHSSLVDNLRRFKGNPQRLAGRMAPVRPVIKLRAAAAAVGDKAVFDLFFLNETNAAPASARLKLRFEDPRYTRTELGIFPVPPFRKDKFVYPVRAAIETPVLEFAGTCRITAELEGAPEIAWTEDLLVVDPAARPAAGPRTIAVLADSPKVGEMLRALDPAAVIEARDPAKDYDLYVAGARLLYGWTSPDIDPAMKIEGTEDEALYRSESWGDAENLEFVFKDLPKGKVRVTLRFAEVTLSGPGRRIFDVAVNGRTVLQDFDIAAAAGGIRKACDRTFELDAEGIIRITIPKRTVNYAKFSAIKIEAGDKVVAVHCGGKPYKDKSGLVWGEYVQPVDLDDSVLMKVRRGASLLVLPEGEDAVAGYARRLAEAGVIQFRGLVGEARAPWMGSWCFSRPHPVLEGLPSGQTMKSEYQIPLEGTAGVLVDGRDLDVFIGYGRDHDRNIGAAAFSVRLGRGKVLFFGLPVLAALKGRPDAIQPVLLKRLLANTFKFLTPAAAAGTAALRLPARADRGNK